MNPKLEKFVAENEPHHKLKKYEEEIFFLYDKGYSHNQIRAYLVEEYDFETTRQTISKLLKKRVGTVAKPSVGTDSKKSGNEDRSKKLLDKLNQ
ncbi:MAG: hypothetical protein COA44_04650 [Arcobacter sp.]|nr:MAG: hypothetical protein COA44_04650 [Arcobacter sp.]